MFTYVCKKRIESFSPSHVLKHMGQMERICKMQNNYQKGLKNSVPWLAGPHERRTPPPALRSTFRPHIRPRGYRQWCGASACSPHAWPCGAVERKRGGDEKRWHELVGRSRKPIVIMDVFMGVRDVWASNEGEERETKRGRRPSAFLMDGARV